MEGRFPAPFHHPEGGGQKAASTFEACMGICKNAGTPTRWYDPHTHTISHWEYLGKNSKTTEGARSIFEGGGASYSYLGRGRCGGRCEPCGSRPRPPPAAPPPTPLRAGRSHARPVRGWIPMAMRGGCGEGGTRPPPTPRGVPSPHLPSKPRGRGSSLRGGGRTEGTGSA